MREYQLEHKGYFIKPHSLYPATYVVVTTGRGGKIPSVLEGLFTSKSIAMGEIDRYLDKPVKGQKNNEAIETSGSK